MVDKNLDIKQIQNIESFDILKRFVKKTILNILINLL